MFTIKKPATQTIDLQTVIDDLQIYISRIGKNTEDYDNAISQLEKLYEMKKNNASPRLSPDAVVAAIGSLLGILLILNHEKLGSVTSKALGFVFKPKI